SCVLVLLRWQPRMAWLPRVPGLRRAVAVMNARAVTVYLWHDAAIVAAGLAVGALALPASLRLPLIVILIVLAVLAVGWIEDLAAGRSPELLPADRREHLSGRETVHVRDRIHHRFVDGARQPHDRAGAGSRQPDAGTR